MPPPPRNVDVVYNVDVVVYVVYVTTRSPEQSNESTETGDQTASNAREVVSTRLSAAGTKAVDDMADAENRSRSQMLRILIHEAVTARRRRTQ